MKTNNYLSRVLCALILCAGLVVTGCKKESIGEIKVMEKEESAVTATTAVFTGQLEVSESELASSKVTVYYSDEEELDKSKAASGETKEFDAQKNFTIKLTGLKYGTTYNYCLVVEVGAEIKYENAGEFTTLPPKDLTENSSANCYIVSEANAYSFKTVKGNSSESVGTVDKAEVLWESFGTNTPPSIGDLIKNVTYEDGYIAFEATDKKGNAVIAAKDADGKILWSWHIWLTDQPAEHVYNNNAGTMMDRNLGATSATPGDVGALGLLYQWGRKDPFLGSSSISDDVDAKSTLTWPSAVSSNSSRGTIDYVISNPTTFVTRNSNNYDWYYSDVEGETDNTRWQSSKTIYDPCPPGWRVPDGGDDGVWSTASGSSSDFDYTYDSTNKGINLSGKFGSASTIWYPSLGRRDSSDGGLGKVGYVGYYWSVTPGSSDAYNLIFGHLGYVDPSYDYYRADGYAVRCLKITDQVAEL